MWTKIYQNFKKTCLCIVELENLYSHVYFSVSQIFYKNTFLIRKKKTNPRTVLHIHDIYTIYDIYHQVSNICNRHVNYY